MEIKTDCFAWNSSKKECRCLNDVYCAKEKCNFYQDKQHINQTYIESAIRSYSRGK